MRYPLPTRALALLLVVALVSPPALLALPQRAVAASGAVSCLLGLKAGAAGSTVSMAGVPVQNLTIQAMTTVTSGATTGNCIYTAILVPLARMIAKMILQKLTASIIKFINGGGSNGTGQPSFVPNLSVHLQVTGDAAAIPFINKIASAFNSPFGPAISAVLRQDYAQLTSLAGFYSANKSTLDKASPNINQFLNGDWSQGGAKAWLSLTTQRQNNPHTLFQISASQMESSVKQIVTNRRQDLAQSGGFLSWCGKNTTESSKCVATTAGTCPTGCVADDSAPTGCALSTTGEKPPAPCTNPDGTPAKAVTPGSIIHGYSQKAIVASGMEQLINANDLDAALGAIVTALAGQILGGARGLLGASEASGTGGGGGGGVGGGTASALTAQLESYSGDAAGGASPSTKSLAESVLENVETYTSSWRVIETAANTASKNVTELINFCKEQKKKPEFSVVAIDKQITEAQTLLTTTISPVLAEALTIPGSVAATKSLATKLQEKAAGSTTQQVASEISTDIATLTGMPPSAEDVAGARQNAGSSGGARADPSGSFSIFGGTLVDRLNLIAANALTLKAVCTTPVPVTPGSI